MTGEDDDEGEDDAEGEGEDDAEGEEGEINKIPCRI